MGVDLPDGYSDGNNEFDTYDFHINVLVANNSWAARVITNFNLPVGILRRALIYFTPGMCNRVRFNLFHGATQFLPIDPTGAGAGAFFLTGEDYWYDTGKIFHYIPTGAVAFTANSWNTNSITADVYFDHPLDLYLVVERVAVP